MNHESANNLNKLKLSKSTSLVLPINRKEQNYKHYCRGIVKCYIHKKGG